MFICEKDGVKLTFKRKGMLYNYMTKQECFSLGEIPESHISKRIQEARLLHHTCGHPSDKKLKMMIDSGVITNTTVSAKDIDQATKLLGACIDCIRGKAAKYRSKHSSEPRASVIGEVLHIDLLYYGPKNNKETFMITVDEASGYCMTVLLKNSKSEEIKSAIDQVFAFYRSYGHTVKRIASDRESSISANKTDLNNSGCVLELTSAEGHDKFAERAIRSLRDRCRSIRSALHYPLPRSFNRFLVRYGTQCMNLMPSSGRASAPWGSAIICFNISHYGEE